MSQVKPAQSYIDQERASVLLEKWAPVLDYNSDNVKPITDDHSRLNTAILLENQETWCLKENSYGGGTLGGNAAFGGVNTIGNSAPGGPGDAYATGDQRLPKILIPMIRRTFPELITNEIVGVQPMSGPVGLAFAMRYKYETDSLVLPALTERALTVKISQQVTTVNLVKTTKKKLDINCLILASLVQAVPLLAVILILVSISLKMTLVWQKLLLITNLPVTFHRWSFHLKRPLLKLVLVD